MSMNWSIVTPENIPANHYENHYESAGEETIGHTARGGHPTSPPPRTIEATFGVKSLSRSLLTHLGNGDGDVDLHDRQLLRLALVQVAQHLLAAKGQDIHVLRPAAVHQPGFVHRGAGGLAASWSQSGC